MAKETFVRLIDDLDNKVIEDGEGETIEFAFDGSKYSIDLNMNNAEEFRRFMKKYTDAGTKEVSRVPRATRTNAKSSNSKEELTAMRAWAKENGIKLSERGRIPYDVQKQYHEAKGD